MLVCLSTFHDMKGVKFCLSCLATKYFGGHFFFISLVVLFRLKFLVSIHSSTFRASGFGGFTLLLFYSFSSGELARYYFLLLYYRVSWLALSTTRK